MTKIGKHAGTILAQLYEGQPRKTIMTTVQELSDVFLRTQDIGRTINVIEKQRQIWDNMKFAPRKGILRSGYSRVKNPGKKRYTTVIQSKYEHATSGEELNAFTTILHDDLLTRGDLEEAAWNAITDFGEKPYFEIIEQTPVQGFTWRPKGRK